MMIRSLVNQLFAKGGKPTRATYALRSPWPTGLMHNLREPRRIYIICCILPQPPTIAQIPPFRHILYTYNMKNYAGKTSADIYQQSDCHYLQSRNEVRKFWFNQFIG